MNFSDIIHDPEDRQFRMTSNVHVARIDYSQNDGKLYLVHSEVPYELRGQGIGKELVEKTFAYIEENDLSAVAVCSFIKATARRSAKWKEIIE